MTAKQANRACVGCGCTDENGCVIGTAYSVGTDAAVPVTCHWVAPGVCSKCMEIARAVILRLAVYEAAGPARVSLGFERAKVERRKSKKAKAKKGKRR